MRLFTCHGKEAIPSAITRIQEYTVEIDIAVSGVARLPLIGILKRRAIPSVSVKGTPGADRFSLRRKFGIRLIAGCFSREVLKVKFRYIVDGKWLPLVSIKGCFYAFYGI